MYLFVQSLAKLFFSLKFKIHFHNRENMPPPKESLKGGFIIACNHQYYWDPPVVAAFIKGKYSFMAKSELFKNRLFAALITALGAFPVSRGAKSEEAINRALEDLKKDRIFVIFPEGTRSKDGALGRGKSGVALIAASAGVPVLPVCLMYGLNGEKRRLDYALGRMISAEELAIPDLQNADRRELKRVSELVMDAIGGLQKQIFENVDNK